jgi:hypothetical protein
MTDQQLQILRYLYVGFRVEGTKVTAPNGKLVQRVHATTVDELERRAWIQRDAEKRYRLTTEGRARVLVKERVRDFINHLPTHL